MSRITESLESFGSHLSSVPETRQAFQESSESPRKIAGLYFDYLRIVRKFADFSGEDRKILNTAENLLKERRGEKAHNSASHMTMQDYEKLLGDDRRELVGLLLRSADPGSKEHQEAIANLSKMMEAGHNLKKSGDKPRDGDPRWDEVIWSHTQIENPEAIKHVVIAHFFERRMSNFVKDKTGEKPEKDSFLNAITNFVILEGLRNEKMSYMLDLWRTPKDQGGLGWASEDRILAIKDAIGREK